MRYFNQSTYSKKGKKAVFCAVLVVTFALANTMEVMAQAATVLTPQQTSGIQTSLAGALGAAAGDAGAKEAAVSSATENAVASFGAASAGAVASVILASAEAAGATGAQIGNGLGQAALVLAASGCSGGGACTGPAVAIATALANEGNASEIAAFIALVGASNPALAALAAAPPAPVGALGNGGNTAPPPPTFTVTSSCLNPSCTAL